MPLTLLALKTGFLAMQKEFDCQVENNTFEW